jgi:GntR family transcriptional regulator, vanillate catabolism transcriptional regulator
MDILEHRNPVAGGESASHPRTATHSGWLLEHLRQALLDGKFQVGSRLNEVRLSETLNVSRTPVRAALQTLAGEGLLRHTPNKGFTVREFPISEIIDAYEMRALAEGLAARLAAERGLSGPARRTIETALDCGDAALASAEDASLQRGVYSEVNEVFHSTILAAAASDLVHQTVQLCQRIPQASAHNVMAFEIEDVRTRHQAHHRIYELILAREPQEAERLMQRHVLDVKLSMVRALARHDRDTLVRNEQPNGS